VKRKRVPGGGRAKAYADTWDSQQSTVMNEVYETERIVSIQSEDRLSSRDSVVSDAGDLKLDARLDRQPM